MDTPSGTAPRKHPARPEEVQAALDTIRRLRDERDPLSLFYVIAQEGARLLDAERATIFLLDRDRCELISQATLDGHSIRLDARLGISGTVAMTGQVINIPDAQQDDRFHQIMDVRTQFRTRSVVAVPLRTTAGDIIGVFQALNKRRGAFTGEDERIAQLLGNEAAILLERVTQQPPSGRTPESGEADLAGGEQAAAGLASTRNIVGTSPRIQGIVRLIDQIRDSAVDVLISGESGTGKEMIAKAIHANSPRAGRPFVALNCAALPDNLVESELFGIEKGVATGVDRRIGKFEQAHEGTLFLDEIGDLSLAAQAKILRALQERVIERVGGRAPVPIDVRVIAATHINLDEAIRQGKFREDLYYRLKVIKVETPPLREVREDIPVLAVHFLEKSCHELGRDLKRFAPQAMRSLTSYTWPGNTRELENEVKRLVVTSRRPVIEEDDLSDSIRGREAAGTASLPLAEEAAAAVPRAGAPLKDVVAEVEARLIREALRANQNNQVKAAKALGLSRQGLIKKMKRHKISSSPHE